MSSYNFRYSGLMGSLQEEYIQSKRYKRSVEAYVCKYPRGRYVLSIREYIWPD